MTGPRCLWRYAPAEMVSGVPKIRQSELIPLLLMYFIFPDFFAVITFLNLANFRFATFSSKFFLPFCALIMSLNFS